MNGFVAGLLVFIGFILSCTLVGAIIGIPLMIWGNHVIKEQKLAKAVAKAINKQSKM